MIKRIIDKLKFKSGAKSMVTAFAVALIAVMGVGSTFGYIYMGSPSLLNIFASGLNPDGNLVIGKTVEHPFGDTYVMPEDLAFQFKVELGADYAGEEITTSQGKMAADQTGAVQVTVPAGGFATIYDIDENTQVTVTELDPGKGFTADKVSKAVTIEKYTDNMVSFTNSYEPAPAKGSDLVIKGVKELFGRQWMEGDSFTFQMEVFDNSVGDEWQVLGTDTVTYETEGGVHVEGFNHFDFSQVLEELKFDSAGTYSFRVTESEGSIGGVTYDRTESYFDVTVGDADMDGDLEIQKVESPSANTTVEGTEINITFNNHYATSGSAKVVLNIKKLLDDRTGQGRTPAGFTFQLVDHGGNVVATSEPTGASGLTSMELVYLPDNADQNFKYKLSEVGAGTVDGGLKYDDKVYDVEIAVKDNLDGTVVAELVPATAETHVPEVYQFTNTYSVSPTKYILSGSKVLNGRDLKAREFNFEIFKTADETFKIEKDAKALQTVTHDENGAFAFEIEHEKPGKYYYVVREIPNATKKSIKYDESVYYITITVQDEEGDLVADAAITDNNGESCNLVFENSYNPRPATLEINGEKVLQGATLTDKMFAFSMYPADKEYKHSASVFYTALNDSEGSFTFEKQTFEEEGEYRYVVKENTNSKLTNITYDDSEYKIYVKIVDDEEGQLEVKEFKLWKDGVKTDSIEFVNVYDEPSDDEPSDDEPSDDEPSDDEPSDDEPSDDEPSDDEPSDDEPSDDEPSDDEPSDDEPSDGEPSDEDEEPVDGEEPKTGDQTELLSYVLIMLSALIFLIVLTAIMRNNKRK